MSGRRLLDRTVHGIGSDDNGQVYEVVRYDRSGKWFLEWAFDPSIKRRSVNLRQAVEATTVEAYLRRPGGAMFDARYRKARGVDR